MKLVGHILLSYTLFFTAQVWAVGAEPDFPDTGYVSTDMNHAMDPGIDYSKFTGRVSDKDDSGRIFKVKVENNNAKFFRSADVVYFNVQGKEKRSKCKGFVKNVEDFYFTIYVENLDPCWNKEGYFRRGTVLLFHSKVLASRVFEAMKYRELLVMRKEDFLKQLNSINTFLWTFDQQKVKVAADYDQRIVEMQKARQKALDDLIQFKQEQMNVQTELQKKLNELDASLKFYQVERQELLTDRWNMDHDAALPVGHRPQDLKKE
jgi:hypothetical protein